MVTSTGLPSTLNSVKSLPPSAIGMRSGEPQSSLSEWYRPGTDHSIYKRVLNACRASNSRLAKYLPPDDVLLLSDNGNKHGSTLFNTDSIAAFIDERHNESVARADQSRIKWLSDATNTFASVALRLADVFDPLIPQSPEYTLPYGCLLLIFKFVVAKQEKKEKVMAVFDSLEQKLSSLRLYDVLFPTDRMRSQLAQTYIEILELVVCVTEYCAIGRTAKLVDILSLNSRYDFDEALQKVETSYNILKGLVESASLAMLKDTHELLKDQSRMIDYITDQTRSLTMNMSALIQATDLLQQNHTKLQYAQMRNWSDDLIRALLPNTNSKWEELNMWQSRKFRLSPRDHWEVNGMLEYLDAWTQLESASVLAIFGPSGDRDTWVTEFSLDIIQAFQVQDVLVLFAMCDRPEDEYYTPTIVIKTLICQALEHKPELIVEMPDILNPRVFQRMTSFDAACCTLISITSRLTVPFAIVVDRIDRCQPDLDDSDASHDLVSVLGELLTNRKTLGRIIITSAEESPEDEAIQSRLPISIASIDNRTRPKHRQSWEPARRNKLQFEVSDHVNNKISIVFGSEQLWRLKHLYPMETWGREWYVFTECKLKLRTERQAMIYRRFRVYHKQGKPGHRRYHAFR